jgi:predicted phage terminase large subunit-like protein
MIRDLEPSYVREADMIQSICRESFFEFVKEFWDVIITEEPVLNWHIPYLCAEMQQVAERVFRGEDKLHDLIINIPPGTTKSTICSIMFPAWVWTRKPDARFITVGYEYTKSVEFARKSRDIIYSEKYQSVFRFKFDQRTKKWLPSSDKDAKPITLKDDQNAKGFYENMAHGDRRSFGSDSNITGTHAHFIIVDDPLNPKEAISELGLKNAHKLMDEVLPSRKVNKAVTPTILIMQRLHQDDPTGHWLAKKKTNVRHICLPAKENEGTIRPKRLRKRYVNGLLDPLRLSQAVLDDQLADLGLYGYAGQYSQDPVPLGGGMFKVDLIQIGHPPPLRDFVKLCRYWDKAGSKDKLAAKTAGVLIGRDKLRRIWILDVVKGQWQAWERERIMLQTAKMDGMEVEIAVEQEPGSGGKESAENTMRDTLAQFRVKLDKVTGDKVTRAEPLAGQVGIGNVFVPYGAHWWNDYRDEMRFFPLGKRKDQIDASSGGYAKVSGARLRVGAWNPK